MRLLIKNILKTLSNKNLRTIKLIGYHLINMKQLYTFVLGIYELKINLQVWNQISIPIANISKEIYSPKYSTYFLMLLNKLKIPNVLNIVKAYYWYL